MEKYMQELVDQVQKEFPKVTLEQVFSGHIAELDGSRVFVELHDETYGIEDLSAEMDLISFPVDPLYPKLEPGNIFYWYLGFEETDDKPFSLIRFSQATWTQEMINKIKEEAEDLMKILGDSKTLDE
jgi:hypothetical protein